MVVIVTMTMMKKTMMTTIVMMTIVMMTWRERKTKSLVAKGLR